MEIGLRSSLWAVMAGMCLVSCESDPQESVSAYAAVERLCDRRSECGEGEAEGRGECAADNVHRTTLVADPEAFAACLAGQPCERLAEDELALIRECQELDEDASRGCASDADAMVVCNRSGVCSELPCDLVCEVATNSFGRLLESQGCEPGGCVCAAPDVAGSEDDDE